MEKNTIITIKLELSPQTYAHVANIENLTDLLTRAAEFKLYSFVREGL